jgi:acetyltransferase-like isoleucine patch superfamily enzyme
LFALLRFSKVNRLLLLCATILPSRLRLALWKLMGFKVGKNCWVSPFSVVVAESIEIGNDVSIFPLSVIYNLGCVKLGDASIISYLGLIYSSNPKGEFIAGNRFAMGMLAMVDCTAGVYVGDFVAIGPRSIIYTHANALPTAHGYSNRFDPVTIGSRVWLMLDVKVMPGVTIASDVHVAPAAIVFRSIKRSGFFLNSYQIEKDVLAPIPVSQRVNPNPEFLDHWFECLFEDIELFAASQFGIALDAKMGKEGWWLRRGNLALIVKKSWGGKAPAVPEDSNLPTLELTTRVSYAGAWLDISSLTYSRDSELLPFWKILHAYFFARRGMALSLCNINQDA